MKVVLLSIKAAAGRKCVNKDLSGGLGTGTWVGDSWLARFFEYVKKTNVVLPEITVAYLAAIFKKFGWEVKVLESAEGLVEPADIVLLATSIVDCRQELATVKALKDKGYFVAVYGTFATAVPEFFSGHADLVIKGEPEAGVLAIVAEKYLPKGIIAPPPIQDLDILPYPDWSLFDINRYSYSPALNKKPVVAMLASRGCPYSCAFYCPYSINSGRKWRPRAVKKVVDEMEHLEKHYGVKAIDFRDPIFTLDRARTLELAREIVGRKLELIWSCETRIDCLDEELLKQMKQAGLKHINVGVESFDENVLKNSRRLPIKIAHQEKIIDFCRRNGITIAAFYIIGLAGDTQESVRQTIKYAKRLNTLVAQFTISTPYPGTEFFEKIKREGLLTTDDWQEFDTYNPVYRHENLSRDEMLALKEKAFTSYYFRPSYLFKHMPKFFMEKLLWRF